jgi:hypothetical protein
MHEPSSRASCPRGIQLVNKAEAELRSKVEEKEAQTRRDAKFVVSRDRPVSSHACTQRDHFAIRV